MAPKLQNERNANHKAQAESTHAHDDAALAPTPTAPPHRGSGGIGSRAAGGIRDKAQCLRRRHVAAHGRRHGSLARHDGDLAVAVAVGHRGRVRDGRRTRGALGPARTPAHPAVEAAVVVPAAARAREPRGPVAHAARHREDAARPRVRPALLRRRGPLRPQRVRPVGAVAAAPAARWSVGVVVRSGMITGPPAAVVGSVISPVAPKIRGPASRRAPRHRPGGNSNGVDAGAAGRGARGPLGAERGRQGLVR